jgi:hypothetical protein
MKRRVRDSVTKRRDMVQSDADCNAQQIDYCKTYHHIDKGNGAEAKYNISTKLHLHVWVPKLAARYVNMNLNNSYKILYFLYKKYHPTEVVMPLKDCIHNLTHSLLQRGDEMRQRGYGAPPSATPFPSPTPSNGSGAVHGGTPWSSSVINYYLKAAALLLNVLGRQRVSSQPAYYSILLYYLHWYISKSAIDLLFLYVQYCLVSARGPLFSEFRIHLRYQVNFLISSCRCLYYSAR